LQVYLEVTSANGRRKRLAGMKSGDTLTIERFSHERENGMGQALVAHTIILTTWEAEIRRITVQSQPRQIVWKTLSRKKKKSQKKD
jgi:hypothetical protein